MCESAGYHFHLDLGSGGVARLSGLWAEGVRLFVRFSPGAAAAALRRGAAAAAAGCRSGAVAGAVTTRRELAGRALGSQWHHAVTSTYSDGWTRGHGRYALLPSRRASRAGAVGPAVETLLRVVAGRPHARRRLLGRATTQRRSHG